MKMFISAILLFSSIIQLSCKKDNPIPPLEQPQLVLSLEDVSCTEAWIKLTTANLSLPNEIELLKDSVIAKTISLVSKDTILYLDSLLPNKTYSLKAITQSVNQSTTSSVLQVVTMDTTSHNFTWQTFEFGGQAGGCILNDVAIIDENNIWAVGEIYLLDSSGVPDPKAYSAVYWNGTQWELKRIKTNACGGVEFPPIDAVFAFSSDDILFAHIDGSISHFTGIEFTNDCSLITQLNGSANKIWGISKNDFYVVSGNGFIAKYRNSHWTRIESGTEMNINGIWGTFDDKINESNIFAVGGNILEGLENIILRITNGNTLIHFTNNGSNYPLSAIWFKNKLKLYSSGSGLYTKNYCDTIWRKILLPNYFIYSIRGNELNDIIVCGGAGYIGHYNGVTWINYLENGLPQIPGNYYSCAVKGNIVCVVAATIDQKAVAVIGTRN